MRIPQWLTLVVAVIVSLFGLYRMWLAFRGDGNVADQADAAPPRRGLYAMKSRTHALVGFVYLLLGASLVATSFGWNPFAGAGVDTVTPSKDTAPSKPGVPQDGINFQQKP